MMKNPILIFSLFVLLFTSCEPEDLLKDPLPANSNEFPESPYLSVISANTTNRCSQISITLMVHQDRLPQGMTYTRHRIEKPDGTAFLVIRTNPIYLEVNCNQANHFYLSLVDEISGKESPRFPYTYP